MKWVETFTELEEEEDYESVDQDGVNMWKVPNTYVSSSPKRVYFLEHIKVSYGSYWNNVELYEFFFVSFSVLFDNYGHKILYVFIFSNLGEIGARLIMTTWRPLLFGNLKCIH